ncbi:MAG TPA: hypothetical protein VJV79_38895, partial [Polyangiaceae bacterium]|nr:hypothetical protein [Polyangiaceae bacterium]
TLSDNTSGAPLPSSAGQVSLPMNSGIPYAIEGDPTPPIPIGIASGVETARLGIATYVRGFLGATQKKQDCTFRTPYDCKNCVKNLNTGSPKLDAKGSKIIKGGMKFFNEEEGDFERVIVGKDLISHRFRDLARVTALVASGAYTIKGKTVAQLTEDDALEFPCSWLTAITRYAGKGEIAWYYALNGISFLLTGKLL